MGTVLELPVVNDDDAEELPETDHKGNPLRPKRVYKPDPPARLGASGQPLDATKLTRREFVLEAISLTKHGNSKSLDVNIINQIRFMRDESSLSVHDPEGATAVDALLEDTGLKKLVDDLVADMELKVAQEAAECSSGLIEKRLTATGKSSLAKITGDGVLPTKGNGQTDTTNPKCVAIFLAANKLTPWHSAFDHRDYLRNEKDKTDERIDDATILDIKMRMNANKIYVSTEFVHETIKWLAGKYERHPVLEYFDSITWDGKQRLDRLLPDYFGTDDTIYHQAIGAKTLIAAARRVRKPGCKFDSMLTLVGPQGARKSTGVRTISGDDWFTDGMAVGIGPKETIELTCGKLIVETAELSGISKRDVAEVKQALSKQTDFARQAYGRVAVEVKRQFVMIGTTNDPQPLKDKTGNRRFWTATVGAIDVEALKRDRDQLWAEAACREERGERIWLEGIELKMAEDEQASRVEDDPLETRLDDLLGSKRAALVAKTDVYIALGCTNFSQVSGSIGTRVASWMDRNGWETVQRTHNRERQRCFTKGKMPPRLIFDTQIKSFVITTEAPSTNALH